MIWSTGSVRRAQRSFITRDFISLPHTRRDHIGTRYAGWRDAATWLESAENPAITPGEGIVPLYLFLKAHDLAQRAHRAGLQGWITSLSSPDCEIRSREELRLWCQLQSEVLGQLDQHDGPFRIEGLPPLDRGGQAGPCRNWVDVTLQLAERLMATEPERRRQIVKMVAATLKVPPGEVLSQVDSVLPQEACEALVRRAWEFMRQLGDRWPAEPQEVKDIHAARRALDQVIGW